jgi:hypothetical protein
MKMICYFKRSTDIIVPDIEDIRPSKKIKYQNFINDYWSERDIELMIRGYDRVKTGKMTVKEVANQLGKSYSSLKNKAWRMGISHGYR